MSEEGAKVIYINRPNYFLGVMKCLLGIPQNAFMSEMYVKMSKNIQKMLKRTLENQELFG